MLRCMLRSKIHKATVTESNIAYDGSLTVDETLLHAAGIGLYEQVMVSNMNNGERFETYVIPGKKDSGIICLNGPTARKGTVGDEIIIFCYGYYTEEEFKGFSPKIVRVDKENRIIG